jgi:hypothetical protein
MATAEPGSFLRSARPRASVVDNHGNLATARFSDEYDARYVKPGEER